LDGRNTVWTNDDVDKIHVPGLISIVGQTKEDTKPVSQPQPYVKAQDAAWYAEQAANLLDELKRRQVQLGEYRKALEDVQSLREMTAGINLDEGDIGITPQAGIEILQRRVSETQSALDALEDLARRNDIPPGALRGQENSEN
jgi:hypothetical protein